jgi:hypothetical protein
MSRRRQVHYVVYVMGDTQHHLLLKGTLNVFIHRKGNLCARLKNAIFPKNAIVHSSQRQDGPHTEKSSGLQNCLVQYLHVWFFLYFFRIFGGIVLSCVYQQNFSHTSHNSGYWHCDFFVCGLSLCRMNFFFVFPYSCRDST